MKKTTITKLKVFLSLHQNIVNNLSRVIDMPKIGGEIKTWKCNYSETFQQTLIRCLNLEICCCKQDQDVKGAEKISPGCSLDHRSLFFHSYFTKHHLLPVL